MKKCTQCGQTLSDDSKFCFKCGGGNFEQVVEGGTYQQPSYQQPAYQQPAYQQPAYQQQAYQQPAYQQPVYDNAEPAKIKDFLIFYLLMLIPIFNIVYYIMVAVGGPKYKVSLTNFVRASLIMGAIVFALYLIFFLIFGAALMSTFGGGGYYNY